MLKILCNFKGLCNAILVGFSIDTVYYVHAEWWVKYITIGN